MKQYLTNPKIMILIGSLDVSELSNQFEELVNNERRTIRRIVESILRYEPDILLVEKSVNRIATEMLHE